MAQNKEMVPQKYGGVTPYGKRMQDNMILHFKIKYILFYSKSLREGARDFIDRS